MSKQWFKTLVKTLTGTNSSSIISQNAEDYSYKVAVAPKEINITWEASEIWWLIHFLKAYPEYSNRQEEATRLWRGKELVARFYNSTRLVNVFNFELGSFFEVIDNYSSGGSKEAIYFKDAVNNKQFDQFSTIVQTRSGALCGVTTSRIWRRFVKLNDLLNDENKDEGVYFTFKKIISLHNPVDISYVDNSKLQYWINESSINNSLFDMLVYFQDANQFAYIQVNTSKSPDEDFVYNEFIILNENEKALPFRVTDVKDSLISTIERKADKGETKMYGNILIGVDGGSINSSLKSERFPYSISHKRHNFLRDFKVQAKEILVPYVNELERYSTDQFNVPRKEIEEKTWIPVAGFEERTVSYFNIQPWVQYYKKAKEVVDFQDIKWDLNNCRLDIELNFRPVLSIKEKFFKRIYEREEYAQPEEIKIHNFRETNKKTLRRLVQLERKRLGIKDGEIIYEEIDALTKKTDTEWIENRGDEARMSYLHPKSGVHELNFVAVKFSDGAALNRFLSRDEEIRVTVQQIEGHEFHLRIYFGSILLSEFIVKSAEQDKGEHVLRKELFDIDFYVVHIGLSLNTTAEIITGGVQKNQLINIAFTENTKTPNESKKLVFVRDEGLSDVEKTGTGAVINSNQILMPVLSKITNTWALWNFKSNYNFEWLCSSQYGCRAHLTKQTPTRVGTIDYLADNPKVITLKQEQYDNPWVFVVDKNFITSFNGDKTLRVSSIAPLEFQALTDENKFLAFREQLNARFLTYSLADEPKGKMINIRYDGKNFNETNWPYIYETNEGRNNLKNNFMPALIYEKHGEFCTNIHSVKVNNNTVSMIGNINKTTLNSPSGLKTIWDVPENNYVIQFLDNNGNVIDEFQDNLHYKHKNDNIQLTLNKTFNWVMFKDKQKNKQWSENIAQLFTDLNAINSMLMTHARFDVESSSYATVEGVEKLVGKSKRTITKKLEEGNVIIEDDMAFLLIHFAIRIDQHSPTIISNLRIGDANTNRFETIDTFKTITVQTGLTDEEYKVHEVKIGLLKVS